MWHLTVCKITVTLLFLNRIKNEMIFYHIFELTLPTLIQRYDKNSFHFWFSSNMKDQLKFYWLSDATFYDHIIIVKQFIKPFLDKKMSSFEEKGAFKANELHTTKKKKIIIITLSTLGKKIQQILNYHTFLIAPENRCCHFMQIISPGDNLHEMSMPIFWKKKKNITNSSSAEFAHRVVYKIQTYNLREKTKYIHELQTEKHALHLPCNRLIQQNVKLIFFLVFPRK